MLVLVDFVWKPGIQPSGAISRAGPRILRQRISALNQPVLDQSVKRCAVVSSLTRVFDKVLYVTRRVLRKELDYHLTVGCVDNRFDVVVVTAARSLWDRLAQVAGGRRLFWAPGTQGDKSNRYA